MNARELMAKAIRAAASAKILLDTGDIDGACDRAYYAMFNAARAALHPALLCNLTSAGHIASSLPHSACIWSRLVGFQLILEKHSTKLKSFA